MMSNHTAEEPDGYLNENIFKTFFSVTGTYPNYKWVPGHETFPKVSLRHGSTYMVHLKLTDSQNWYRRPSAQQYTAALGVFGDLASEFAAYPDSFRFGGNTNGKRVKTQRKESFANFLFPGVNTYTGIDLTNFTGGVFNGQNLLDPTNLACFAYQNIQMGLPDVLSANPFTTAATALLNTHIGSAFGSLTCPGVAKFNNNDLPPYKGRTYSPNPPANAPENC